MRNKLHAYNIRLSDQRWLRYHLIHDGADLYTVEITLGPDTLHHAIVRSPAPPDLAWLRAYAAARSDIPARWRHAILANMDAIADLT